MDRGLEPGPTLQCRHAAFGRFAVPQGWLAACRPTACQGLAHLLVQLSGLHEAIGAFGDGDWPLRVLAQREARDTQVRALLLHTAGIRDDRPGTAHQVHELDVAQWLGEGDSGSLSRPSGTLSRPAGEGWGQGLQQPKLLQLLLRPGVHGENQRQVFRHGDQLLHQRLQRLAGIHVGRPVQRDDSVPTGLEPHRRAGAVGFDLAAHHLERVEHDVAYPVDLGGGHAFAREVLVSVRRRRPIDVADRVRDQAIDLLGHAAVSAPQSCLEVHDRNPELGADLRAGGRRIDVADDDDPVGLLAQRDFFVSDHYAAGLLSVRAAAHLEMEVRLGQPQVAEERVRHVGVVVLPGMDDLRGTPRLARERVVQRRDLHEVRPGGGDQVDDELGICGHCETLGQKGQSPYRSEVYRAEPAENETRFTCRSVAAPGRSCALRSTERTQAAPLQGFR